jgi:hypothetical protein
MQRSMQKPIVAIALVALAMIPLAFAAPCQTGCAGKTALKCAVDGLSAHQWCEFATPGAATMRAALETCNSSSASQPQTFTETDTAVWDPVRNRALYGGSPHHGGSGITTYDEATNTWNLVEDLVYPPFVTCRSPATCANGKTECNSPYNDTSHGYDHNAMDPTRGEWFIQQYNSQVVNRSVDRTNWTPLPNNYCNNVVTNPIVYFPDRTAGEGLFRLCQGSAANVNFWERTTNTWSSLVETGCTLTGAQDIYGWAEYDPVNKLVWFGGQSTNPSCTFKADGTFDQEAGSPFVLSPKESLISADPVRGGFIVRNECSPYQWRTYDPIAETWATITWSMPPVYDDPSTSICGAADNIEVTIAEYNVIMYISYNVGNPKVFLYRHSDSTPPTTPAPPTGVRPV